MREGQESLPTFATIYPVNKIGKKKKTTVWKPKEHKKSEGPGINVETW